MSFTSFPAAPARWRVALWSVAAAAAGLAIVPIALQIGVGLLAVNSVAHIFPALALPAV